MKVKEKKVTLSAEAINALIEKHGCDFTDRTHGRVQFHIDNCGDNEIEVNLDPVEDDDDRKKTTDGIEWSGTVRYERKSFKLDDKTCQLVASLVSNHLETRNVPGDNDLLKAKADTMEKDMNTFIEGLDKLLKILSDERMEKIADKLAPKVGMLIGKTVGGFAASVEKGLEEGKEAVEKD